MASRRGDGSIPTTNSTCSRYSGKFSPEPTPTSSTPLWRWRLPRGDIFRAGSLIPRRLAQAAPAVRPLAIAFFDNAGASRLAGLATALLIKSPGGDLASVATCEADVAAVAMGGLSRFDPTLCSRLSALGAPGGAVRRFSRFQRLSVWAPCSVHAAARHGVVKWKPVASRR